MFQSWEHFIGMVVMLAIILPIIFKKIYWKMEKYYYWWGFRRCRVMLAFLLFSSLDSIITEAVEHFDS